MTENGFGERRQELLDAFKGGIGVTVNAEAAGFALDYKYAVGDPDLTHWVHADIDALFLGYLPAEVVLDDDQVDEVVDTFSLFLLFLEEKGLMTAGSDSARDLVSHLRTHRNEFRLRMADPEEGGPAKRLVMAMRDEGVDLDDEEAVERWMAEFNDSPSERREAVLGPAPDLNDLDFNDLDFNDFDDVDFDDLDGGEPVIPLPLRPPVDPDLARASAAEAPLLRKILALADYVGEGRRLTATGNLKLADARELVERLETGDRTDLTIGDKEFSFRSSPELMWLDLIVWLAREIGAVEVRNNKMSATKAWRPRGEGQPLEAATDIAQLLVNVGPLSSLFGDRIRPGPDVVIDGASVSLLAALYEGDQPFDDIVDAMAAAIPTMIELPSWYLDSDERPGYLRESVEGSVETLVHVLEWAGLLTWTGAQSTPDPWGIAEHRRGGTLSITPFGTWSVQGPLADDGFVSAPVASPLTVSPDDPPEDVVAALAARMRAGPEALVQAWEELGADESLPERLWRVDSPDTAPLLEALGRVVESRAAAKAARKALLKHRSWLAGRS